MICDFDLNRFFNDFDLTSLLNIKIIILELQELIVVVSLYSCRSLRLSWLGWLPVSMVSSNAKLLTDEYTVQFQHSQLLSLNLCLGLVGQQWFHCIVLTLCSFIISWFVDLNQNLCDFDLNQFGTTDFDLI